MAGEPPDYLSFMLRLWRVQGKHQWRWRVSIENLAGERHGFHDLAALFTYLAAATGADQLASCGQAGGHEAAASVNPPAPGSPDSTPGQHGAEAD